MDNLNTQLLNAVISGNLEQVKYFISQGANIDAQDTDGNTLLIWAIYYNYNNIADFLIENNIKLNTQNKYKETALMQAAYNGNTEIVKKLIERGADINTKNINNATVFDHLNYIKDTQTKEDIKQLLGNAKQIRQEYLDILNKQLFNVVKNGNLEQVKNLIKQGADINAKDNEHKMTLLTYAIGYNHNKIANFFIDNNAELDEQNIRGETALIQAIHVGNADIVKKLIERDADIGIMDENKQTAQDYIDYINEEKNRETINNILENAQQIRQTYLDNLHNVLIEAINDNDQETVIYCIDRGVDINKEDVNGIIALKRAIWKNRQDILKILIKNGLDINKTDKHNDNALIVALDNDNSEIAKILIENNVELNMQDTNGDSPLIIAMNNFSCSDIIKILIEKNVDVNIQNNEGDTPLIVAVKTEQNTDIIKSLIEHGANVTIKNNNRETVFDYAYDIEDKNFKENVMGTLQKAEEFRQNYLNNLNKQLFNAVENNNLEDVKKLIERGADINAKDNEHKMTLLTYAIGYDHNQIANFLIDNNIELNEQNTAGETDLMRAIYVGNADIVKKLIERGANIDIIDNNNNSTKDYINYTQKKENRETINNILQNAQQIRQDYLNKQLFTAVENNNLEDVKKLIKQGADINAKDYMETTVLTHAVCCQFINIVQTLVENGADINIKDKSGDSALTKATAGDNKDILEIFINNKCLDINDVIDTSDNTLLTTAISYNHQKTVNMLIQRGVNINMQNSVGDTLLMMAIERNCELMSKRLLKYNVDVNIQNNEGDTALIMAMRYCADSKIIKSLIEHGANVNIKNKNGETVFTYLNNIVDKELKMEVESILNNAQQIRETYLDNLNELNKQLFVAVQKNELEEVKKLIKQGADINAQNSTKSTPLIIATFLGKKEMVKLLIDEGGAVINIQNENGFSASDYISYVEDINIQQDLQNMLLNKMNGIGTAINALNSNDKITCPIDNLKL